jgi:hypothetical protein
MMENLQNKPKSGQANVRSSSKGNIQEANPEISKTQRQEEKKLED